MRGLRPPPGPSLQDARWGLANLAKLLGLPGEWTRDPSGLSWGLPLCRLERPFSHRRDLLLLSRAGNWWIHRVLGLENRAMAP